MSDETEPIEISREDEMVEALAIAAPIQKPKKPLSMAKKKALLKANEARKRNAETRKKVKKMQLAREYLDEMIPDEPIPDTILDNKSDTMPDESEEEEIVYKRKPKPKPKAKPKKIIKRTKKPKVVYYSETESDSEEEDERGSSGRDTIPYTGITFL